MDPQRKLFGKLMDRDTQRWILGLVCIFAIASIWIAASYIVQSVVDAGVSPFLVTYICNSLFVIYIPLVEIWQRFEDSSSQIFSWWKAEHNIDEQEVNSLLPKIDYNLDSDVLASHYGNNNLTGIDSTVEDSEGLSNTGAVSEQVDAKGRWTRTRVAKVSLLICPFWFFAQLAFNLSLKYTTVTSNTILSSTSSLFTFLVSLAFLGEKFSWVKLISVLLCMGGTIIVSLADSEAPSNATATNSLVGDVLSLLSAALYAVYITLIQKKLPDEEKGEGQASTAQFLGFLGFFNLLIFLPIAVILHFTKREAFDRLKWKQFGLIVGKGNLDVTGHDLLYELVEYLSSFTGLLDNVLSDYLWVKATQLTTSTVATAGLSIQVPIAAIVDTVAGRAPGLLEYIGALFVMLGFAGINIPSKSSSSTSQSEQEQEQEQEAAQMVMVELSQASSS